MVRHLLFFLFSVFLAHSLNAQTDYFLGDGNVQLDADERPATYATNWRSAKYQYLIPAAELQALGMGPSLIQAIAFDIVQAAPTDVEEFSLTVGGFDGNFFTFNEGLETVYGPLTYTPIVGWNTHVFDEPYEWDGVSDIVLGTCFRNDNNANGLDNSINRSTQDQDAFGVARYSDYNGPNDACDDIEVENFLDIYPNMRITAVSTQVAPTAAFNIVGYNDCSATVSLQDSSFYTADSWMWYFGDGATSNDQNPSHSYTENGVYDISLVVSNQFGTDSITVEDIVTVVLPENLPGPAACTPQTQNQNAGFGPVRVQLATLDNSSPNGAVGYEAYTCLSTELTAGQVYDIVVTCDGGSQSVAVAWIDYNGNGSFEASEKLFAQQTTSIATGTFTVPTDALIDSTLRMRVSAEFYLNGELGPCDNPSGGQTEDYSVRITPNVLPPLPAFDTDVTLTCDGEVAFTDLTQNAPENWFWEFGDGGFSNSQNPVHVYTMDGLYTVTLTATNVFGQVDTVYTDLITVDLSQQLTPAACEPTASDYCCDYGVIDVDFAGLVNSSADGSVGYEDFTCGFEGTVTEGASVPFTIVTGGTNPHDLKIYLDGNDDGQFDASERILLSANAITHTGTIVIPDVEVNESRIRLRIAADFVGNSNNACSAPLFGQVEDYAIIVLPDTSPPEGAFSANPLFSCDGVIDFTENSAGSVDSVVWYFGDGTMANGETVTHTYPSSGTYTVSMVAINAFAQDSVAYTDYITVDFSAICDTLAMPFSGTNLSQECVGILVDNGGDSNYSNDTDSYVILNTDENNNIRLEFFEFGFLNGDSLIILDGPSTDSPLIGAYSGFNLPNGGVVISSGASMTVRQKTNGFGTVGGFVAQWECQPLGLSENGQESGVYLYPNPASDDLYLRIDDPTRQLAQLDIYDMSGRMVLSSTGANRTGIITSFDIRNLESGHYTVSMDFDTYRLTSNLVISR